MPPDLRRALVRVQPVFIALALVLLAVLLRRQWSELRDYEWQIRPLWLLGSGAGIVAGWLLEIRIWQQLVVMLHAPLPYRRAVSIWFASAIVRYVPGSIWQPLSLTTRCQAEGVRPSVTLASLSLYHVVHVLAVVPIGAIFFAGWGAEAVGGWLRSPWWAVGLVAPVVVVVARPVVLLQLANVALAIAGREPLPLTLGRAGLLRFLAISLVAWVCFAAGFASLTAALLPANVLVLSALPYLLAAYPLAFAVGFAALFAPSGLAVREGVLYALLAPALGGRYSLVAAIGMRVWEMLLDLIVSGLALANESSRRRRHPR